MARKPRVWFPGAIYHVTSRGNRRSIIFYDDSDRIKYFEILNEAREKFPFHLHSYCLMTNHTHLLLETITDPLFEIMKMVNSRYAMYFNKRNSLVGHVFQGRYGASLVTDSAYLLDVSRYIHMNPVEAGMVRNPSHYPWSSYRSFTTISPCKHTLLTTKAILSHFPNPPQIHYREFVENAQDRLYHQES